MSGRGAERSLLLVEWMAGCAEPVSLAQTVAALNLPKSSALGLLRMLVDLGYAERTDATHYRLVRLPGEATNENPAWGSLLRLLQSSLAQAVSDTGESGFLAVLEPEKTVRYLNKVMPEREIRYDRDISVARRAWQVSSGIVLLAGLSEADLAAYLDVLSSTEGATIEPAVLLSEVREAQRLGYHANPMGVVEGAAGVAAPILDRNGRMVAALNIAGPADRISGSLEKIIDLTVAHAERCSAVLAEARGLSS
ncbi:helix-turn-helix domain-containing protein [Roseibacterium beibuensis]|uniref:IclR family transcriptional regulator C-terminal domain-containing protein n=1 Tax=[Roseibacterium] beibuensis TaxID=1193142 RepID=A0ABP9KT53_9RHOB|nr:IclR family transcriptional regulator C-terminal domain-containing protein [Roseibacterium beibuensis]MCS6622527.1 helix-turn-helix domain-containing protein [Roseibacterium beibuensis]